MKNIVVAHITRSETCVYHFSHDVSAEEAQQLIESGEYDPVSSKIHEETVDVVDVTVEEQ